MYDTPPGAGRRGRRPAAPVPSGPTPETRARSARSKQQAGAARIEERLAVEREAGFRLMIETARPRTAREVAAKLPRLGGKRPVVKAITPARPARSFLVRYPGVSAQDLTANPFDLAHELRERSRGQLVRVEPDLPQQFREPDADALADVGLSGGCWEPDAGPEDRFWHLRQMQVGAAWSMPPRPGGRARGAGIRVGHPDTGWTAHPEVEPALDKRAGFDFVDDDSDARDPLGSSFFLRQPGHGTRTGSVIAARFPGGLPAGAGTTDDIAGVAPDATIVPIRAIRSVVIFYNSDVVRAIDHAVAAGCHVISMSLGGVGGSELRRAVDRAVAADVIVCAAAGNCVGWVVEPASFPGCIAVGGTNPDLHPWKGSSAGAKVEVSAPGTQVWAARPDARGAAPLTARGQGTSFAVASVAGAAALWLAHHGRDQRWPATAGGCACRRSFAVCSARPRGRSPHPSIPGATAPACWTRPPCWPPTFPPRANWWPGAPRLPRPGRRWRRAWRNCSSRSAPRPRASGSAAPPRDRRTRPRRSCWRSSWATSPTSIPTPSATWPAAQSGPVPAASIGLPVKGCRNTRAAACAAGSPRCE